MSVATMVIVVFPGTGICNKLCLTEGFMKAHEHYIRTGVKLFLGPFPVLTGVLSPVIVVIREPGIATQPTRHWH